MVNVPRPGGYYYLDTSVVLGIVIDGSAAGADWIQQAINVNAAFVSSRLLRVEAKRGLNRKGLDYQLADEYLEICESIQVLDSICELAENIQPKLAAGDAIHVATALRLMPAGIVLLTHDAVMATAAKRLALPVFDPVTDDPNCSPVA